MATTVKKVRSPSMQGRVGWNGLTVDYMHAQGAQGRDRGLPVCIPFSQIQYFQSSAKCTEVHHANGVLVISTQLWAACEVYGEQVVQVNRGIVVVRSQVEGWTTRRAGMGSQVYIRMLGTGRLLPVSRRMLESTKKQFSRIVQVTSHQLEDFD